MGLSFDADLGSKLKIKLEQTGARVVAGMSDTLREGAEEIQTLAKAYAPYASPELGGSESDAQHLQEAIEVKEARDGQNGRLTFTVFVNGRRRGHAGRSIASYAFMMHELLEPYGDSAGAYNISKSSADKGPGVGGKFLERAYTEKYRRLIALCAAKARNLIR